MILATGIAIGLFLVTMGFFWAWWSSFASIPVKAAIFRARLTQRMMRRFRRQTKDRPILPISELVLAPEVRDVSKRRPVTLEDFGQLRLTDGV